MLVSYSDILETVNKFRAEELSFHEYKLRLLSRASLLGNELGYEKNWESTLDAWLELIEYYYGSEEWYNLGCSLGEFLEYVIKNEPRPLRLPENDKVVREHFIDK